ncbi:endonuclease/exonuclease/phosphatase family domain-containing protein 1-like [Tubulanus polymorphus]|uniref:endonuclease/exonuclease/phosphatase family domain-containing protein 1-like n=1 Tax=Tubulanus polymorphus TaxID=672921 RepID=UPI003DA64A2E
MGAVNSCCIPKNGPDPCFKENHATPKRLTKHRRNPSATWNLVEVPNSDSVSIPEQLNINTASEEELMTLPGVNRAIAQAIVAYRRQIDGFKKIEDIALVSGIGAAKMTLISSEICVNRRPNSQRVTPNNSNTDLVGMRNGIKRKIAINGSNVFQLMKIKGINQQLAENITAYRDKKGNFKNIDDLVKVKGFNPSILSAIRHQVTLNAEPSSASNNNTNGFLPQTDSVKRLSDCNGNNNNRYSSVSTGAELIRKQLTDSQLDILAHFRPLFEKHERPDVTPFDFKRKNHPAFRVASWNLKRCGCEKADNPGVLEVVCRTILENGFSIIAFQELADKECLQKFCAELNQPTLPSVKKWKGDRGLWKCCVSEATGRMFQGNEYNGFIYDVNRNVSFKGANLLQMASEKKDRAFTRRPFIGFFQVDKLDFVLVSVHLKATGLGNEDLDELEEEILRMPALVEAIKLSCPGEEDVLILGDFNLNPDTTDFDIFRRHDYINLVPDGFYTNISKKNKKGNRTYDNIWINKQTEKVFTGKYGVVRQGLFHPCIPDNWSWGGVVSDHCPVWGEFYCHEDLDVNTFGDIDLSNITLDSFKRESTL